ncbi:PAS domain-containing protein [Synechococcus sp. CS-602]|nr:PAS domain-containing protein [Synechococcus sp. CS-602]MCT0245054.1 PAS domain-containing protein [Synechococcus sp. CS-601]
MIVDDSPEDREMYRRYMVRDRDHDYTFIETSFGEEGLNLWRQHHPDAVLLDYRLPDQDGLEFLAALQKELPLPIVMMTAVGSEEIAVKAIKSGAQDYLVKEQITPENLKHTLDATIKTVQLEVQLQNRIDRESIIAKLSEKVFQTLDLDMVLQTIVKEVRNFLKADRVVVFQANSIGKEAVAAEAVGSEWKSFLSEPINDPSFVENYIDNSQRERNPLATDGHNANISPGHVELLKKYQVQSNLVVPILNDGQLWGGLIAHHCAAPRQWQALEIDLLHQLSTQVSVAIRQAELYQEAQRELVERSRTEEVLRNQDDKLRLVLEAAGMTTWDWDLLTNSITWSSNMGSLFGLGTEESKGTYDDFVACLHPDDRERVLGALQDALTQEKDYNIDFRVLHPNQGIRWASSQATVFTDQNGKPIRMSGCTLDITERKQSECRLQESETQVRRILDGLFSFVGLLALDGTMLEVNRTALEAASLVPADVVGKSFPDTYWWAYDSEVQAQLSKDIRQAASGETVRYDVQIRLKEDHLITIDFSLAPLYNQAGDVEFLIPSGIDISERVQAQAALKRSQDFNKRIIESSNDCIKVLDLDARLLYMNAASRDFLKSCKLTVVPQTNWLSLWNGDYQQAAKKAFTTAKSGEVGRFQGNYQPANGLPIWRDVVVTPIFDSSGQVIQILTTTRDITQQRLMEEQLRQKNAILDVVNESSHTLIFLKDRQGKMLYANSAVLQTLGKTESEVIGHYDYELFPNAHEAKKIMDNDQRVMASRQVENVQESIDDSQVFLSTKAPYFDENGDVIGLVGIGHDITDRIKLEHEREDILQQKQYSLEEAQRVNRIKDEFLAVLSHELRSPLGPILGWTQLLQTRKLDDTKTTAALATIERNAKAQCRLIDDLLDMACVLQGKLSLKIAPVSLKVVIESAIETVQTAAIAKSVQIRSKLSEVPTLSGDSVRLQQVIWNLLTNAVKFTPSGGQIDIRLENVDNQAEITITDTGKGISPEFLPYIFESFCQEDTTVTRKYGGLGLGMAIVYQLVEAHGGRVTAESLGEGKGACFTVKLPLLKAHIKEQQPKPSQKRTLDLTGIRLLIIDDDPDSRDLLDFILDQAGAESISVSTAAEFFPALESFQPDVVVSDIGMPEIDGYTLLKKVRSLSPEQGGQVPMIALTAYAGEVDRQRAITAGFEKHITKPIEPDQLVVTIADLLSKQSIAKN